MAQHKGATWRDTEPIRLTQAQLAVQVGLDSRDISNYVRNGEVAVGPDGLISLRDFFQGALGRLHRAREAREMAKAAEANMELLAGMSQVVDVHLIRERYAEKLIRVQQVLSRKKGITKELQQEILKELADA